MNIAMRNARAVAQSGGATACYGDGSTTGDAKARAAIIPDTAWNEWARDAVGGAVRDGRCAERDVATAMDQDGAALFRPAVDELHVLECEAAPHVKDAGESLPV